MQMAKSWRSKGDIAPAVALALLLLFQDGVIGDLVWSRVLGNSIHIQWFRVHLVFCVKKKATGMSNRNVLPKWAPITEIGLFFKPEAYQCSGLGAVIPRMSVETKLTTCQVGLPLTRNSRSKPSLVDWKSFRKISTSCFVSNLAGCLPVLGRGLVDLWSLVLIVKLTTWVTWTFEIVQHCWIRVQKSIKRLEFLIQMEQSKSWSRRGNYIFCLFPIWGDKK